MTGHAEFSPSRLVMLQQCAGFLGGLPSAAASRGTDIHATIAAVISGELVTVFPEDQPLVDYARACLDEAIRWCAEPCEVLAEVRLTGQIPGTSGTADAVIINEFESRAVLIDWKTGFSARAEPSRNLQLKTYGAALVGTYGLETIRLMVVELDKQHITTTTYDGGTLVAETLPEIHAVISAAKSATEADYRQCQACKWCVKSVTCPAIENALSESVEVVTIARAEDPATVAKTLAPRDCGEFLTTWKERVEMAASILKHVEGRAVAIIEAGGEVPGWEIGEGRKTRKWADEWEAAKVLEYTFPGVEIYERSLMSPAAIEKTLGKKVVNGVLKDLVRVESSKKLQRVEVASE